MSLQELHIKALEQQVLNLTRDCHYLMSLLNSTDEIDWDNWDQGRKIKEDLERSKDFFDAMKRRSDVEASKEREENSVRKQYESFDLVKDPCVIQKNYLFNDISDIRIYPRSNITWPTTHYFW